VFYIPSYAIAYLKIFTLHMQEGCEAKDLAYFCMHSVNNSYIMKTKTLKLIAESAEEVQMISQKRDPSKPFTMKFRGPAAVSARKNANGRTYPYELLKKEMDKYDKEMVQTGRAIGELEHSSSPELNPDRASVRFLSLSEDNGVWIAEGVILCSDEKFGIKGTPCGDTLAALTNYGTKWGLSTRALGDVDETTGEVTDLQLCTIDSVVNPSIGELVSSNGDRFVNGILESKQFICSVHGEVLEEKYNKLESSLKKMPSTYISSKRNAKVCEALNAFFKSLSM
jgi:hypothetical protein